MATKFDFVVRPTAEITDALQVQELYGPSANGFQDSIKFTLGNGAEDHALVAPFDCRVIAVPNQDPATQGDRIQLFPVDASLGELYRAGYLPEIPTSVWLDGFEFIGPAVDFRSYVTTDPIAKFGYDKGVLIQNNDEATITQVTQDIQDGGTPCHFKAGDTIGFEFPAGHSIEFTICTTRWIDNEADMQQNPSGGWNTMDPLAFWSGLVRYQSVKSMLPDNGIADKMQRWLQGIGGGLIEVRDEHNAPIHQGHPYERSFSVLDDAGNLLYGFQHSGTGRAHFPGAPQTFSLKAEDNDDLLVFDSTVRSTVRLKQGQPSSLDLTGSPVAPLPCQLIFWLLKPAGWFAYFRDLHREMTNISSSTAEHYFHILAWSLNPLEVFLVQGDETSNFNRSLAHLRATNPQKIRVIVYMHPIWDFMHPEGGPITLNDVLDVMGAKYVRDDRGLPSVFPDLALPGTEGDHHMKVVSIVNANGRVAYCGGIDIWDNRLTDAEHEETGSPSNIMPGKLHDIQLKVAGPAAAELERVFRDRWMDHPDASPKDLSDPALPVETIDGCAVQVATTIPKHQPYAFASNGDTTLHDTLVKAIASARQYVYIEDQYFAHTDIAQLLYQRLDHLQFVIIVGPAEYGFMKACSALNDAAKIQGMLLGTEPVREALSSLLWSSFHSRNDIAFSAFRDIINQHPKASERFRPCYLANAKGEYIFPHSKVVIVDDIFVSCGSANIDCRGMGNIQRLNGAEEHAASTECNLMCIDTNTSVEKARKFARDFRIRLWLEHDNWPLTVDQNVEDHPLFSDFVDPARCFEELWKKGKMHRIEFF